MGDIGDIRRAASGAARNLRQFTRAISGIRARLIRAVHSGGREVFKLMYVRHSIGVYANAAGVVVPITPYGTPWGKRKAQLGLDLRPGIARKGVLKTIRSPLAFVKRSNGFDIDLTRPNLTITGKATLGKSKRNLAGKRVVRDGGIVAIGVIRKLTNRRSFAVNSYLGHFADSKAPGLGNIANTDVELIRLRVGQAIAEHLASVKGMARRVLSGKAQSIFKLRLDRVSA